MMYSTLTNKYHTVFVDWHGVLSDRGYWASTSKKSYELAKFTNYLFESSEKYDNLMRNKITLKQVLKDSGSECTVMQIQQYFLDDIKLYKPNIELLTLIKNLFSTAKIYILTDNIILFEEIITFYKQDLSNYIDGHFSSHVFGALKKDTISLFEYVKNNLGLQNFENCLLLDDNFENCAKFKTEMGNIIWLN